MSNSVYVKVFGGFGNQLFCYACGYAVARESDRKLILDTSQQDNDSFRKIEIDQLKIKYSRRITFKKGNNVFQRAFINKYMLRKNIGFLTKIITEKREYEYDPSIFKLISRNIYLSGYWQSFKYFQKYENDLRGMFTPTYSLDDNVTSMLNKIKKYDQSVALHIRRGDYIGIGCSLGMELYQTAIKIICEKVKSAKFFIFSDDINFANQFRKQHMNLDMEVVDYPDENHTLNDFFLMSSCKHQIIANSSYSWWAAWVNSNPGKIVICPKIANWKGDFYPDDWVMIDATFLKG